MIPRSVAELDAGMTIAGYRLERLLARGGMGIVYLATDLALGRRVALKVLGPELAGDADFKHRFERESRTAVEIEHPNVVPVYAAGEDDGLLFIAMRYVEGVDLGHIIREQSQLAVGRVVAFVEQIGSGLDAAHVRGLVHRDVKPGNVMVEQLSREREHCYLVDFGLAKLTQSDNLTRTGQVLATLDYASPEQLTGGEADARSDVYSLGVLAFHALTGHTPFSRSHDASALFAQLREPPPRASPLRDDLSPAVDAVLARALRRDPARRFGSAGELAAALAAAAPPRRSHSVPSAGTLPAESRALSAKPTESAPSVRDMSGAEGWYRGWSRAGAAHNLPVRVSRFIGREQSVAELGRLLQSCPLVTLAGPGGVGKTRLALQVGADWIEERLDGVWLVDLTSVECADEVAPAVARVLQVRDTPGQPVLDKLIETLEAQELLLVLDNCEHVIEGVSALAKRLLESCPAVSVLATSREPLALAGEQLYRLTPLAVPAESDSLEALRTNDAVRLLLDRAQSRRSSFTLDASNAAAIGRICRRLDGIPLAIELASARLAVMSPEELDDRLERHLEVLAGTARDLPARQQTLAALVDWSWQLLASEEQRVMARLSVFSGGFDLGAAEAVIGEALLDALASLVEKSLLELSDVAGSTRYSLLEIVRDYASLKQCSAPAEERRVRAAHRQHYLKLAESAAAHLFSRGGRPWIERLGRERANLEAALASSVAELDTEAGLRLVVALSRYWGVRAHARELCEAGTTLLAKASEGASLTLRVDALNALSQLASAILGDYPAARTRAEEALAIARALNNRQATCESLWTLAWIHGLCGEHSRRSALLDEAFALVDGRTDPGLLARLLKQRAWVAEESGDSDSARRDYLESLELLQRLGDLESVGALENDLANLAALDGQLSTAREHVARALDISSKLGDDASAAISTAILGLVEYLADRPDAAHRAYLDSFGLARRLGDAATTGYALLGLALAQSAKDDLAGAGRLHGAADAVFERIGHPLQLPEAELRHTDLRKLHRLLGDSEFERAYQDGQRASLDELPVSLSS